MTYRIGRILTGAVLFYAGLLDGQTPAAQAQFEVASIKASSPSAARPGRMGSVQVVTGPGRLSARTARLTELIKGAYGIEDYQLAGGPAWIGSATFDVEAKSAGSASRAQLLVMLRSLLADRFQLALHRETREMAIYALTVAKGGPKFHALTAAEAQCWPGCAASPGKVNHIRQKDLPSLATFLTRLGADKPVIDKTGLAGGFAIDLDMAKILEEGPEPARMFEATVTAVQEELGLKLTPAKAAVEVLAIDRAVKPAEN